MHKMASAGDNDTQTADQKEVLYRASPDQEGETKLSREILRALDAVPGYDVEDSEMVVYDYIDLDAVDELFSPVDGTPRRGEISFPIEQYEISVTAAGEVTVATRPTTSD